MASETRANSREFNTNSFNIWRIVFTLVIMVFHLADGSKLYDEYPFFQYRWYIAVEFFFVLSGYLMMQHARNHPQESVWEYIKARVFRLYPEYIVALLVMVLLKCNGSPVKYIKLLAANWLEIFMLQSVGTNEFPYLNNPAWYVSSLLIGSYIIYYLLKNHEKLYIQFIGPVLTIVIFSFMYRQYGSLQPFYSTDGLWFNQGVMRALMGITLGIYVYLAAEAFQEKRNKKLDWLYVLIEAGIFISVLVFALFDDRSQYDFLFLILFTFAIGLASFDSILGKVAGSKVVSSLSEITYSMYLIHFAVIRILSIFFDEAHWYWWHIPVYIVCTILIAFVIHYLIDGVKKRVRSDK